MSTTNNNIIAIENLKSFHFTVEDYQRGYKWGIQQIKELLEDILDFKRDGVESFYCLQPVVVKKKNDEAKEFELIDGQQRLTTIYIILKCLNEEYFTLDYNTRPSSRYFLDNIEKIENITDLNISGNIENEVIPRLNNEWNGFIKEKQNENNVDNYHFFNAYQFINSWLTVNNTSVKEFKKNLLEYTKVIWYEHSGNDTAEQAFIKFNHGKIELAQAELIKALFVLEIKKEKNIELRSYKLNQFAEEWNYIENQLQDDSFWYFVSNDSSDKKKYNRIDLLFDLISNKPTKSNNKLFSYHYYLEGNANQGAWKEINDLFNQLYEWYNDRLLYHLIGFIIFAEIDTIIGIRKLYLKFTNKTEFTNELKRLIYDHLYGKKAKNRYDTDIISYGNNNHEITILLVLHNVISYYNTDKYYRFPFDRLKNEKGWSLEHIHAQNPKLFETVDDVRNWIKDIESLADKFQQEENITEENLKELKSQIEHLKNKLTQEIKNKGLNSLKGDIQELDDQATRFFNKDSISNLCLLDGRTNSAIGNKFFEEKRKVILEIDGMSQNEYDSKYTKNSNEPSQENKIEKPFVPLATKYVFLKYYTRKTDLQMSFWGAIDRESYKNHIKTAIKKFLNK